MELHFMTNDIIDKYFNKCGLILNNLNMIYQQNESDALLQSETFLSTNKKFLRATLNGDYRFTRETE